MLKSMYSGITGLKNFQTKLDVIGNNVANVNTHGFKKGRVIFKDLFSQTTAGASGATATRGGTNPQQIGLGSQVSTIDTLHGGGSPQFTGNTLDLAIAGDGFFVVVDDTGEYYTRVGNFYLDADGDLVDGDGRTVKGDINIPEGATSISIGQDGTVNYVLNNNLVAAGRIEMVAFRNPGGLEKVGGSLYQQSANSGDPEEGFATEGGIGTIQSGSLEMSNVDLSEEFTEMIVAQRGFQANTRTITTSDEILQELMNLKR